jgi:formylmethanofuran dehydrogenase subunit E
MVKAELKIEQNKIKHQLKMDDLLLKTEQKNIKDTQKNKDRQTEKAVKLEERILKHAEHRKETENRKLEQNIIKKLQKDEELELKIQTKIQKDELNAEMIGCDECGETHTRGNTRYHLSSNNHIIKVIGITWYKNSLTKHS